MKTKNTVLVVAAHPDDEVLGCGGTIINHVRNNDDVYILIMAEGITSRDKVRTIDIRNKELLELHAKSKQVADILGAKDVTLCNFPDNRMDSVDLLEVVKKIEDTVNFYKPNIVYTHHCGDVNIDHNITHRAVVTACRPFPGQSVQTLLFFETLSSTEWQPACSGQYFTPNWLSDVTEVFAQKIMALKYYESEMREWPHARSYAAIEYLAKYRGASVGVDFAEAFMLGRMLIH